MHPSTIGSRHNLAAAHRRAGDYERAIPLLETVLRQSEEVFGEAHPNTVTSRKNLVVAYLKAGDLAHAAPLLEHPVQDAADGS